ncbi:uncharacterized protein LOC116352112 isoform X2 [Contarinia nasturtii]|uniref:uncharacterized protein LOC116352112 isoform X2 n=1 Tax=Contarinia nasturtii TaxID=265458 RepID=UPI0012D410D5|nr:uncharacterized protein LOC116352112 isoform X2 [Contarinia nasturtii]
MSNDRGNDNEKEINEFRKLIQRVQVMPETKERTKQFTMKWQRELESCYSIDRDSLEKSLRMPKLQKRKEFLDQTLTYLEERSKK